MVKEASSQSRLSLSLEGLDPRPFPRKPKRSQHALLRTLRALALAYAAVVLIVTVFQSKLIYFPSTAAEPELLALAERGKLAPWRDASGGLIGWKSARSSTAVNRLVVFHGNAGFALNRGYFVEGFESLDAGRTWEVYLFEYPGYGARPGQAGEAVIKQAALTAVAELKALDPRPIFVTGESLGSGVATYLAAEAPDSVAGVFLVTPFSSLTDVASHHYPFLPVKFILRERYDCIEALSDCGQRLAILLAGDDEVVPAKFGRKLYEAYGGPKRLWMQETASHNTVDYSSDAPWWREVSQFLLGPK